VVLDGIADRLSITNVDTVFLRCAAETRRPHRRCGYRHAKVCNSLVELFERDAIADKTETSTNAFKTIDVNPGTILDDDNARRLLEPTKNAVAWAVSLVLGAE
jgi:hypothetical protein